MKYAFLALLLAACSGELNGGFVVDTAYKAPYTTCTRTGKTTTCTHHPAQYKFLLRDCGPAGSYKGAPDDELEHVFDSDHINKVDCVRVWREVGKDNYGTFHIGDWYGSRDAHYEPPPSPEWIAKCIFAVLAAMFVGIVIWFLFIRREYPTWSRRHAKGINPTTIQRIWRWWKYRKKRKIWAQQIELGESPKDGGYR